MTRKIVRADVLNWLRVAAGAVRRGLLQPFTVVLGDPPYGIEFAEWDVFRPSERWRNGNAHRMGALGGYQAAPTWAEMTPAQMREYQQWITTWATLLTDVVYPGALGLFFGGARTAHRLAVGLEDAGWAIRGQIAWLFADGMPKGLDISKSIDRAALAAWLESVPHGLTPEQERKVLTAAVSHGVPSSPNGNTNEGLRLLLDLIARFCPLGELPPGVCRVTGQYVPPDGKTWNLQQSGDENIEAAPGSFTSSGRRVLAKTSPSTEQAQQWHGWGTSLAPEHEVIVIAQAPYPAEMSRRVLALKYGTGTFRWQTGIEATGRWPGDVLISEKVAQDLGQSAAYFYCAKADTWEREAGLDDLPLMQAGCLSGSRDGSLATNHRCRSCGHWQYSSTPCVCAEPQWEARDPRPAQRRNDHVSVKPLKLNEFLARLVLPPPAVPDLRLLNLFAGSGSEGIGAHLAGWPRITMVERDAHYLEIARHRLAWWGQFGSYEQARRAYAAARRVEREQSERGRDAEQQLALFDLAACHRG